MDADAWYHEVIDWANANDVLFAYDNTAHLGSNDSVERAQFAAMLKRLLA